MTQEYIILLALSFSLIAALYSSVGHAGASGYLAIMALFSFAPESIKPTTLILNSLVALIAATKFIKLGYFDRKLFLPLIMSSLPLAFFGGYISLSPEYFKLFAGLFLILSALFLLARQFLPSSAPTMREMPLILGLSLGGLIGFISGLIGVGGGIFLSPIIIIGRWADLKQASGIAALFILFNSLAGLAGHVTSLHHIDQHVFYWIIAVAIGGLVGSHLGANFLGRKIITICLFFVLISAGLKFLFVHS